MDDVLQEDGEVLQGQTKRKIELDESTMRQRAQSFQIFFEGTLLELILAQHHPGRENLPLIGMTSLSGQDRAAGCLPCSKFR